MSHEDLVRTAERWLRARRMKLPVVLPEVSGGHSGGETPDAIGYGRNLVAHGPVIGHTLDGFYFCAHNVDVRARGPERDRVPTGAYELQDAAAIRTVLVECKVSLADFHADKRKRWRTDPELGMGSHRYYLCPDGLIDPEQHGLNGWGLLYAAAGRRYRVPRLVVRSKDFWPKDTAQEMLLLTKWAAVVETAIGNTGGDVWRNSPWRRRLVDQVRAIRKAAATA